MSGSLPEAQRVLAIEHGLWKEAPPREKPADCNQGVWNYTLPM